MIKKLRALALLSLLLFVSDFSACPRRIEDPRDCRCHFDPDAGRTVCNSACGPKKFR